MIVYVAHPIKGKVKKNLKRVSRVAFDIINTYEGDVIPIAPYYFFCNVLNDKIPTERALGQRLNKIYFTRKLFDELWLYGTYISDGMFQEIKLCLKYNIPIIPMTKETSDEYNKWFKKHHKIKKYNSNFNNVRLPNVIVGDEYD